MLGCSCFVKILFSLSLLRFSTLLPAPSYLTTLFCSCFYFIFFTPINAYKRIRFLLVYITIFGR